MDLLLPQSPLPRRHTYRFACELAEQQGPGIYYDRYQGGDHEAVWRELVFQDDLRDNDVLLADATWVARETMRRCRSNIELLVERLQYHYRNHEYPKDPPFTPPPSTIRTDIEVLEQHVGAIPLSLGAWLEQIGEINFIIYGRYRALDPLCVWSLAEMRSDLHWDEFDSYFVLPFSVDCHFKAGYGGGAPYAFVLPDSSADVLVHNTPYGHHARPTVSFVTYLRHCFHWAGFPHHTPLGTLPSEADRKILPSLEGLLPI